MCGDSPDLYASDIRHLTPQQWLALRTGIVARAHEERRQFIRRLVGAVGALMSCVCRITIAQTYSGSQAAEYDPMRAG